jgi:hypothetical protein
VQSSPLIEACGGYVTITRNSFHPGLEIGPGHPAHGCIRRFSRKLHSILAALVGRNVAPPRRCVAYCAKSETFVCMNQTIMT